MGCLNARHSSYEPVGWELAATGEGSKISVAHATRHANNTTTRFAIFYPGTVDSQGLARNKRQGKLAFDEEVVQDQVGPLLITNL